MNPKQQFCHEESCHASGQVGQRNIVIHSRTDKRYKCKCCGKTFTESKGTAVYGLKKESELHVTVITLLSHGCPLQAIVAAYELDERTVKDWRVKAGLHCQEVHEHLVEESQLDLGQVQADEIRVKAQGGIFWMAFAMMVSTRLWLGGAISPKRDKHLIHQVAAKVRRVALCRPLLIAVDGLVNYVGAFRDAFRTPPRDGTTGPPRLIAWPDINIVQVVKRRNAKTLESERRIVQGDEAQVASIINDSQGGGVINTAFIERLNATFRQRIHCLARRTRSLASTQLTLDASMYLMGCTYNFCSLHRGLGQTIIVNPNGQERKVFRTPAMAARITDHVWSMADLLLFKVPTSYKPPTRRGRLKTLTCPCGLVRPRYSGV